MTMNFNLASFTVGLIIIILVRVVVVFWQIFQSRQNKRIRHRDKMRKIPAKTVVVLGSGGHTTEMMRLLSPENLSPQYFSPLIHIVAVTDTTSEAFIKASSKTIRQPDITVKIPRSREVGQSYLTSILTTLYALFYSFYLVVFQIRPSLILCNGPGTCLPIAMSALFGRILGICEGKVIFIESFCRVQRLSLTGKILYFLADRFFVHWEELNEKYYYSELLSVFIGNKNK